MIMKIYDDDSGGMELYTPIIVNAYVSTHVMCRAVTMGHVLLYLPNAILTTALEDCIFCFYR